MTVEIRDAAPRDEVDWRRLWASYVAFYRVAVSPDVTTTTWGRIVDPGSPLFMRVAVLDGHVVGFALCLLHEATWVKEPVCYLEDLFLDESGARKGYRQGTAG